MKKVNLILSVVLMSLVLFAGFSCNKDKNATLQVMLTDSPADYDALLIDIQEVAIFTNENKWEIIPLERPGVYNLLDFKNGLDTILGSIELPAGSFSEMRMILGEQNSLIVNGESYQLMVPSGSSSGLKFKIKADLLEGVTYRFWIDFDAARSIVEKGNGQYTLKPVIRTFSEATSGSVKGFVIPAEAGAVVSIFNDTDTLGAVPEADGRFLIRGVPAGNYTVLFDAQSGSGYNDKTISGVNIENGVVKDLGITDLSQK